MTELPPELPQELPKHFDPKSAEQRIYAQWEEAGCFKPDIIDSKPPYSIVIPPPNVTGSLHMGHALNHSIQDILARFHRMTGHDVLWQPGTDHAGIATQMVVERQLAEKQMPRSSMSREGFLKHVWAWKRESGGMIFEQDKRLGVSCDWSREKFTLGDPDTGDMQMADAVTKAFVDLYNKGLIYRDKRLVNWDPHFQTAISDLEVENREVPGHFWHFKYPLEDGETYTYVEKDEDGNVTFSEERDYISIATTRPETMLGDGAVAVHPDDERYAPIVGKMVRLPLADRLIPIITDEYPDPDFGSGAVKITGAHDFNDYEVAKRGGIPMYSLMGAKGEMIASEIMPDKYVGMDRFEARNAVVADIDAEGLLIKVQDKTIMQPFGDRSNVVIEPMLTDQWFVDAEKLAGPAMEAVNDGRTQFIPENWKKTYDHWMENIQPWCISRQLWWGHRVPAWYGPAIRRTPEKDRNGLAAIELDYENDPKIFVGAEFDVVRQQALEFYRGSEDGKHFIVSSGEEIYESSFDQISSPLLALEDDTIEVGLWRDPDVLDTWFSSGLWPFSTLGWPNTDDPYFQKFYPTSVLVTAFDIIFFWVARMMMQGLEFTGEVPFRDVYIHALVLDENGKKMSKSIGNTIDPLDLIDGVDIDTLVAKRTRGLKNPKDAPKVEKATRKAYPDGFEAFGADALRFTLASQAAQGRNIRLSVDRIAGYRNFGTKLWNASRFAQMNGCRAVPGFDPASATSALNKWVLAKASETAATVADHIKAYRFSDAADAVYSFVWGAVCDWYIELAKPELGEEADAETQATLAFTLDSCFKMLHPFMPFITEELWSLTGDRDTFLIKQEWPTFAAPETNDDIDWLIRLISSVRSVRAEMNVPPSKKADLVVIGSEDDRLSTFAEALGRMARVEAVRYADAAPSGALQTVVDGVTYAIPLDGLIDIEAEQKRLDAAVDSQTILASYEAHAAHD
ncbi:MAG: valine--tRNA ligase, partial [Pseudomonadota bacterium]